MKTDIELAAEAIARVPNRRDRELLGVLFAASGHPDDPDLRDSVHAVAVSLSGDGFDPVWGDDDLISGRKPPPKIVCVDERCYAVALSVSPRSVSWRGRLNTSLPRQTGSEAR